MREQRCATMQASARPKAWPSPQDYNDAMQNLSTSLSDPDLNAGEADFNSFGFPKAISGTFASVYRIKGKTDDWAVRFFLHNRAEQEERYKTIHDHLGKFAFPYTVLFEYQDSGLLINNNQYPILKMDWARGVPLNEYVFANRFRPQVLTDLALELKAMICWLGDHMIAHGDLQHGNILVNNGKLRLVDYDAMFVPGLAGKQSSELGHRNYQHPARSEEHFDLWLDNFSAWVIYVSIFCLSKDGSLLNRLGISIDDECLLFRQSDFQDPLHSRTFYELERHYDSSVREMAKLLRSFLQMPLSAIPNLLSLDGDQMVRHVDLLPIQLEMHHDRSSRDKSYIQDKNRQEMQSTISKCIATSAALLIFAFAACFNFVLINIDDMDSMLSFMDIDFSIVHEPDERDFNPELRNLGSRND